MSLGYSRICGLLRLAVDCGLATTKKMIAFKPIIATKIRCLLFASLLRLTRPAQNAAERCRTSFAYATEIASLVRFGSSFCPLFDRNKISYLLTFPKKKIDHLLFLFLFLFKLDKAEAKKFERRRREKPSEVPEAPFGRIRRIVSKRQGKRSTIE